MVENAKSISEVTSLLQKSITPLGRREEISLCSANGRICAEHIYSPLSLPTSNNAAVDGFDPSNNPLKMDELNILDRWVIAKTHVLTKDGQKFMEQYRVDAFMKCFEIFLEELSNWYIRRNRRRFWKSEDDQDKNSAYATLYHVLTNLIRSIAPVLPFISETIYQNLVINSEPNSSESVHLCDYPKPNEKFIEMELIKNVDSLKKFVELGRSARSKSKIKIRQPLEKAVSYTHLTLPTKA